MVEGRNSRVSSKANEERLKGSEEAEEGKSIGSCIGNEMKEKWMASTLFSPNGWSSQKRKSMSSPMPLRNYQEVLSDAGRKTLIDL